MATILVVDDELGIRELLFEILNDEGHTVELAQNAAQARNLRAASRPDLVLLDIWMPDTDGVSLLKEWAQNGLLSMPVIMMSGHATIETAVEATKIGAAAFLEKPITMNKLLTAISMELKKEELRKIAALISVQQPIAPINNQTTPTKSNRASTHLQEKSLPTRIEQSSMHMIDLQGLLRNVRDEFEKAYFLYHLERESCSMTRVAEKTGLERTHLYRKLKQLGIDLNRNKTIKP